MLLSPFRVGALQLPNRMVLAPMTRNRSGAANVPTALRAMYYRQRATAGFIVTEASQVPAAPKTVMRMVLKLL
jgi:N-ethylmaleimide reductase